MFANNRIVVGPAKKPLRLPYGWQRKGFFRDEREVRVTVLAIVTMGTEELVRILRIAGSDCEGLVGDHWQMKA